MSFDGKTPFFLSDLILQLFNLAVLKFNNFFHKRCKSNGRDGLCERYYQTVSVIRNVVLGPHPYRKKA